MFFFFETISRHHFYLARSNARAFRAAEQFNFVTYQLPRVPLFSYLKSSMLVETHADRFRRAYLQRRQLKIVYFRDVCVLSAVFYMLVAKIGCAELCM
jgi:hypothetical protein